MQIPVSLLEKRAPQTGVPGTKREAFIGNSSLPPLYVDQDHSKASDQNMGQTPDEPFATIQAAINAADDYQTIVIKDSIDHYEEALVITGDEATHLHFIGVDLPIVKAPTAGTDEVLNSVYAVHCEGIHFLNDGGSDGVPLIIVDAVNASFIDCKLQGNDAETVMLDPGTDSFNGWIIKNNRFIGGGNTTTVALDSSNTALLSVITGNLFSGFESIMSMGACDDALIAGNYFGDFATTGLLTANATGNGAFVAGNYFSGTYSIAGGYSAGTNNYWLGNLIAGGLTTADPA